MSYVFIINGTTMCIRDLNDMDIKDFYYGVMSLLSNDARMLIIQGELYASFENKYKICVVEDMNSHMILGTGVVYIENSSTKLSKVGNIKHVGIQSCYNNTELKTNIVEYLKKYCLIDEKCIKMNVLV
jgi:hypothetical protein